MGQEGTEGGETIEIKLNLLYMFAPSETNSRWLIKNLNINIGLAPCWHRNQEGGLASIVSIWYSMLS